MAGHTRAEQNWEIVRFLLLRQFMWRSLAGLGVLAVALCCFGREGRVVLGALVGGGWMVVNCAAMSWLASAGLRSQTDRAGRYILGLMATIIGMLFIGGWIVVTFRLSLLGVTLGFSTALAVFIVQLWRLKVRVETHAR